MLIVLSRYKLTIVEYDIETMFPICSTVLSHILNTTKVTPHLISVERRVMISRTGTQKKSRKGEGYPSYIQLKYSVCFRDTVDSLVPGCLTA